MSLYVRYQPVSLSGGGGGGGTPGGSNGQLQYNNSGVFGGDTSTTDGAGNISLTSLSASGLVSATVGLSSANHLVVGAGTATIRLPNAGATTYNFNLPNDAGTGGYALLSGGGVNAPMTWGSVQGTLTIGALDAQAANATGLALVANVLSTQSADATHPGLINNTTQTLSGSKTLSSLLNADGGIDRSTSGTLTIGATNSTTINIGNSGATVNIQGTTIYENTPHLIVADPLITVNSGGGAGSGQNSGIEVNENNVITGYLETSSDRNSWILKAPNTAGVVTITPGASGFVIDQGTHNPLTLAAVGSSPNANGASLSTQVLTLQPANTSFPGVLLAADWNTFNNKQAAGNYITALTGDATASGPGSSALTLATVNSNVGSFAIATVTANAKGLITAVSAASTTGSGNVVLATSPTLVTPALGTPSALVGTNITGTAAGLTAGNVTTNANLTGVITSSGNATSIASQTGTGTKFVVDTSPTLVTPVIGVATGTSLALTGNASANTVLLGYTTTATAAGTTTLTSSSTEQQFFTGTTTQTVVLPVTSTLTLGQQFVITNNSTGVVTVQSSGANTIQAMIAGSQLTVTVILTSGTGVASWSASYVINLTAAVQPTVQKFTSGTSQTYTTPTGVQYIRVRMVGGGGSGAGGGTSQTSGNAGNNTTFGAQLAANGGAAGTGSTGGAGGTATLGSGPIGTALSGGGGMGPIYAGTTAAPSGGSGGNSAFGGGGSSNDGSGAGGAGATNSGAGGGGGSTNSVSATSSGGGGGAGGFVDAILTSPSATYTYTVGASVAGGTGSTSGGAGAAGYIEVTEYYTNLAIGTSTAVTAGTYFGGPYSGSSATPTFKAFQAPIIQKFTSGTAQTYTTNVGALYLRVRMVGGGAGGCGSGTSNSGGLGGAGGTTFFRVGASPDLLVANGGNAGAVAYTPVAGGTASLGSGPTGTAIQGGYGGPANQHGAADGSAYFTGGQGGVSPFGGGGGSDIVGAGLAAIANSGSGGGGAGTANVAGCTGGAGGSAGGFIDAIITSPSATYTYTVGASGVAGTLGTAGSAGGAGGSGYIEVTAYFQ